MGLVLLAREELLEDAEDGVQQAVADNNGRADGEVRAKEPRECLRVKRTRSRPSPRASSLVVSAVSTASGDRRRRRANSRPRLEALDAPPLPGTRARLRAVVSARGRARARSRADPRARA